MNRVPFVDPYWRYPDNEEERMQILRDRHKNISDAVNAREVGLYPQDQEFDSGQRLYGSNASAPNELVTVFRKVISFPDVTAGTTGTEAHGLTRLDRFLRIQGGCSEGTNFRPIPSPSDTANSSIEIYLDATNVNIVCGSALGNLTNVVVVLDYTRV